MPLALFKLEDANRRTEIDARHRLGLPGLECPVEGPWGTLGIAYPTLSIKDLDLKSQLLPRPVKIETFNSILEKIRMDIGDESFGSRIWKPGVKFGPLEGTGQGKRPKEMLIDLADLLMEKAAFTSISKRFPLQGIEAKIEWRTQLELSLVEIEIIPSLSFLEDDTFKTCEACGRVAVRVPSEPTVRMSSYRPGYGLYRGKLCTTVILCDEEFKQEVEALGLSGVDFVPVKTIE